MREDGKLGRLWETGQERAGEAGGRWPGASCGSWHLFKLTELKSGCERNSWLYQLHLNFSGAIGDGCATSDLEYSPSERLYSSSSLKILSLELLPALPRLGRKVHAERKTQRASIIPPNMERIGNMGNPRWMHSTLSSKGQVWESIQLREESPK